MQADGRNRTPLFLSAAFFLSAGIDFAVSGWSGALTVFVEIAAALIALSYWIINRHGESTGGRPLGITILGAENLILGVIVGVSGIVLLFLPIFGIIGFGFLAIGVALVYLGRGLLNGTEWSTSIQTILAIIGVIGGLVAVALHYGNPTLAIFQLWYLRRPYVQEFFEGQASTTIWSDYGIKNRPPELTCTVCGARNPNTNANCSNCGIRMFSGWEGIPFSGATEDERIVRLKLERVQDEFQKMNRIKQEGKIVDHNIFEKAYNEREFEIRRLKTKLDTITPKTPG